MKLRIYWSFAADCWVWRVGARDRWPVEVGAAEDWAQALAVGLAALERHTLWQSA